MQIFNLPLCKKCGYNLQGIDDECPECGKAFSMKNRKSWRYLPPVIIRLRNIALALHFLALLICAPWIFQFQHQSFFLDTNNGRIKSIEYYWFIPINESKRDLAITCKWEEKKANWIKTHSFPYSFGVYEVDGRMYVPKQLPCSHDFMYTLYRIELREKLGTQISQEARLVLRDKVLSGLNKTNLCEKAPEIHAYLKKVIQLVYDKVEIDNIIDADDLKGLD